MWIALLLVGALIFGLAAALFSPMVWFLAPAIALLALAIAVATGLIGVAQDRPDLDPKPDETGDATADDRVKGFAHEGQAPGHSA